MWMVEAIIALQFCCKDTCCNHSTKSTPERAYRYFYIPPASKDFYIATSDTQKLTPPNSSATTLLKIDLSVVAEERGVTGDLLRVAVVWDFFYYWTGGDWAGIVGGSFFFRRTAFVISCHSLQCFEEKQKAYSSNSFPQLLVLCSVSVSWCVPVSPCRQKLKQLCSQACRPKAESSGAQIPNQGWWRACLCVHVLFLPNPPPAEFW